MRQRDQNPNQLRMPLMPQSTQKTFYVEISRAKDSAVLITDDKSGLAFTLEQNTGEQTSALEGISAGPRVDTGIDERLDVAIDTARIEMSGVSFEEHEVLNADAPEHSTDDYAGSGDWRSLTIWSVKRRKWNMNYRCG